MHVIHKWKYCVVGNIVETRIDENGILRYGTAAFRGGTRVYLCGKRHDFRWKDIDVIGMTRGRKYTVITTPMNAIQNVRLSRVWKPDVVSIMNDLEFHDGWWHDTDEDRQDTECFIAEWDIYMNWGKKINEH